MITINTIQTGTSIGAVPPVKVLHEEMVTIPINGKERAIDTILRNDLPWQSSSLWRKKITRLVDNGLSDDLSDTLRGEEISEESSNEAGDL